MDWIGLDWVGLWQMDYVILFYLFLFIYLLLRQMAAHIKYTNQYTKKHTIHSIKRKYKLGLQMEQASLFRLLNIKKRKENFMLLVMLSWLTVNMLMSL